jgi:pimeloyl-ACP methyl ester carboxylesterase
MRFLRRPTAARRVVAGLRRPGVKPRSEPPAGTAPGSGPLQAMVQGSGPTVIFLHGQPGSRADWARVAPLLADHTVVVADRPGYGATGGQAEGFKANAARAVGLLDRLGVARAVVVAHSWAGGVALHLAADHPQRVEGIVLVASVHPGHPPSRLDRMLANRPLGDLLAALSMGAVGRLLSWSPARSVAGRSLVSQTDGELRELSAEWRSRQTWRSFATEQRALVGELPALGHRLADVRVPAVVLVGTHDRVVSPAAGRDLAAELPQAQLVEVPGAGHALPQQQPEAVASAVRRLTGRGAPAA